MIGKETFHVVVHGRVQGVGFRYFVRQKAEELELCGWVRNCPNQTVEIEVQGERSNINTFIDYLRIGNGYSRTDKLNFSRINQERDYHSFQIKY